MLKNRAHERKDKTVNFFFSILPKNCEQNESIRKFVKNLRAVLENKFPSALTDPTHAR